MGEFEYKKRIGFKFASKDKWLFTYWWGSGINTLSLDLENFLKTTVRMFDTDTILIKIERQKTKEENK